MRRARWTFAWGVWALLLAGLGLSGPALADDYDDYADGNWNAWQTWSNTPASGFPDDGTDTAVIDDHKVITNIAVHQDIPITVGGTGILELDSNQKAAITLNAGGTLWLKNTNSIKSDAVAKVTVNAPANVKSTYPVTWYNSPLNNKGYQDGATTTGTLTVLGGGVAAVKGDNTTFSGGWHVTDNSALRLWANGAAGTGSILVDGGCQLQLYAGQTGAGAKPSVVVLKDGALFNAGGNSCSNGWQVVMEGGSRFNMATQRFSGAGGSLTILGDVTLEGTGYYGSFDTGIYGDETVTITAEGANCGVAYLMDNSANYFGDWEINGTVRLQHELGLGSVTATQVTIHPGGALRYERTAGQTIPYELTIHDGSYLPYGGTTHTGTVHISGSATLDIYKDGWRGATISARITEASTGKVVVSGANAAGEWTFTDTNNDYTGGTDVVQGGNLKVTADGQIGTGSVMVNQGYLRTDNAGTDVLTAVGYVEARRGQIQVKSTELATTTVSLKEYGSLYISGGSTPQNWGGNIRLVPGAVLDPTNIATLPTTAQVGGQLYMGLHGNVGAATTYTVGTSSDPGKLWKGVATAVPMWNWSVGGTFNENEPGAGFEIFVHRGSRLISQNSLTLNATGKVTLAGDETVYLDHPWLGTATTVQVAMVDGARVYVRNAGTLAAGKIIEVASGVCEPEHNDALAAGSLVDVKSGGVFFADKAFNSGSVIVRTGGAARMHRDYSFGPAGMYTWELGSYMVLGGDASISDPRFPTDGKENIVITYLNYTFGDGAGNGIVLSDDTKLIQNGGQGIGSSKLQATGSVAHIVHERGAGSSLTPGILDLAGKTLKVGYDGALHVPNRDGGWSEVYGDGHTHINDASNQVGTLEIIAGMVSTYGFGNLGSPSTIILHDKGVLQFNHGNGNANCGSALVVGTGTLQSSGSGRRFYFSGTDLSPGASVGILPVEAYGDPVMFAAQGADYCTYYVDVAGARAGAEVPGTDHDQIKLYGPVGDPYSGYMDNVDVVVQLPLPSGALNPNELGDMAILHATGGFTQQAAVHSVTVQSDYKAFWALDEAQAIKYAGNDLVLTGTAISWTAHKGDADLNNEVDVLDLSKLANNFGRKDAGVNWMSADFDFNGEVDVLDLAAIANAFGWKVTGGEGGAPVPEPASLVLLGVGAFLLIRRRGR